MERLRGVGDKATEVGGVCFEHGLCEVVVEGLGNILLVGLGIVLLIVDANLEKFETV